MKVLEVIAIFQKAAGTSVFCAEVAKALNGKDGVEAVIAVPEVRAEGLYEAGANTRVISISEAMAGKERWDAVHIHGVWSPVLHKVARWAKAEGIPIVWSPHGMLRRRALIMKWWKKLAALLVYQWRDLRKAAMIHVCSEVERREVGALRLGVPMTTIPLGVDAGERAEGTEKEKMVLYVGRINRGKGLMNLVNAWDRVREPGWKVTIAGFNEEGCEEELKRRVAALGLDKVFEFPGPVYGRAKERLMAAADILVLPSLSENFGATVIEALAQGTPVIATKGTPWEELEERKCGWWVDIGVEPMAAALKNAIDAGEEVRRDMGERGRKWVSEVYTWESVAKAMLETYERVVRCQVLVVSS